MAAYSGGAGIAPSRGAGKPPRRPTGGGGIAPPRGSFKSSTPKRVLPPSSGLISTNPVSIAKQLHPTNKNRGPNRPQAHSNVGQAHPTDPLAPLSPQQIRQQAGKTVTAAYASGFTDLNQQQQQAKSLYASQEADNRYFANWLASQGAAMSAQVNAANDKLAGLVAGIKSAQDTQFAAVPQATVDVAQARPGTVTNRSQDTTFGSAVPSYLANAGALSGNAAEQTLRNEGIENVAVTQAADINQGRVQALRSKQLDALTATMKSIANDRAKLIASRTGDIAKEIARLQGVELSKAQYQENQRLLGKELGLKTAVAKSQSIFNRDKLTLAQQQANEAARHNQAMERISRSKGDQAAARQAEIERHNKVEEGISQQNADSSASRAASAAATAAGKAGKVPHLTPGQQNALVKTVTDITGRVNQLISQFEGYGASPQDAARQAFQALKTGRYYAPDPNNPGKWTWLNLKRGPVGDIQLLNAAYNLRSGGNGLTPGDLTALQKHGLQNPQKRFHTIFPGGSDTSGPRRT